MHSFIESYLIASKDYIIDLFNNSLSIEELTEEAYRMELEFDDFCFNTLILNYPKHKDIIKKLNNCLENCTDKEHIKLHKFILYKANVKSYNFNLYKGE